MIGHLAYMAALNAPEIVDAAGDMGGGLVEAVGRRLAAGMSDEIARRFNTDGGSLLNTALSGLREMASNTVEDTHAALSNKLADAIGGVNASLVANDELALLREIAAAVASNSDPSEPLERLKAFHQKRPRAV